MDKLSVVIPIYNKAPYLNACLDSLLAQSYACYEAWLVDDGSTDGSGAIADEYAQKDHRLQVIHQSNGGVSAARNAGIEAPTGRWLVFMDADDQIGPTYLQRLAEQPTPNGVTIFNYFKVEKGVVRPRCRVLENHYYGSTPLDNSEDVACYPYNQLLVNGANGLIVIYARIYDLDVIRRNHICFDIEHSTGEDVLFNQAFVACANTVNVYKECVNYYYKADYSYWGSVSVTSDTTKFYDKMRAFQEVFYRNHGLSNQRNYPYCVMLIDTIEHIFRIKHSFSSITYLKRVKRFHGDIIAAYYHPTTTFFKIYIFLLVHNVYLFYLMKQFQRLYRRLKQKLHEY